MNHTTSGPAQEQPNRQQAQPAPRNGFPPEPAQTGTGNSPPDAGDGQSRPTAPTNPTHETGTTEPGQTNHHDEPTATEPTAEPDRFPSAEDQIRAGREAAMRYLQLPFEIRAQRRAELVANRDLHRSGTDYAQLHEQLDVCLSAYRDEQFTDKFAREFTAAGASRVLPRRCKERGWVLREDKRKGELREDIANIAGQLDAIDAAGGYDSAEDCNPRWEGPPPGDTHLNRAWRTVLVADLRQLRRITARGCISWRSWLRRTARRAAIPAVLAGLGTWSVIETGVSAWSAVAWAATVLGVWLTWTASTGRKDDFMVAVHDILSEHVDALFDLAGHMKHGQRAFRLPRPFTRDPSRRPLTELLTQR